MDSQKLEIRITYICGCLGAGHPKLICDHKFKRYHFALLMTMQKDIVGDVDYFHDKKHKQWLLRAREPSCEDNLWEHRDQDKQFHNYFFTSPNNPRRARRPWLEFGRW